MNQSENSRADWYEMVAAETLIRDVIYLESTASTNDFAKQLKPVELQQLPTLIVAAEQRAGRGQQGNRWWSGPGSLTFSVVLDEGSVTFSDRLPVVAALAVCRALALESAELTRESVELIPQTKWPNDLFVNGRKIGGVLIETVNRGGRRLFVVGIGVNTNCQLAEAPAEIRMLAISLVDVLNRETDQRRFVIRVLKELDRCLSLSSDQADVLIAEYQASSIFVTGQELAVVAADGSQRTGNFAGFGQSGELRLRIGQEFWETSSGHIESPVFRNDNSATTGN